MKFEESYSIDQRIENAQKEMRDIFTLLEKTLLRVRIVQGELENLKEFNKYKKG